MASLALTSRDRLQTALNGNSQRILLKGNAESAENSDCNSHPRNLAGKIRYQATSIKKKNSHRAPGERFFNHKNNIHCLLNI